jgi:2-iminobutanoate/2-iminopropanoate deaminase
MNAEKKKIIKCTDAPAAIGPYSQAIQAGDFLFVSGQIPIDPGSGEIIKDGIERQTSLVIENAEKILRSAGLDLEDVVRVDVFLSDIEDFTAMNEVYGSKFTGDAKPARCVVQAARLPKDVRIELSCIAFAG